PETISCSLDGENAKLGDPGEKENEETTARLRRSTRSAWFEVSLAVTRRCPSGETALPLPGTLIRPLPPLPGMATAKSPSDPPKTWIARARIAASPCAVKISSLASGRLRLMSSTRRPRSQRWTTPPLSRNATRWPSSEREQSDRGSSLGERTACSPEGWLAIRPSAVNETEAGNASNRQGDPLP